jgi:hypothetical protein
MVGHHDTIVRVVGKLWSVTGFTLTRVASLPFAGNFFGHSQLWHSIDGTSFVVPSDGDVVVQESGLACGGVGDERLFLRQGEAKSLKETRLTAV